MDALYISACADARCPYSNDEVLTESEMVSGRDCVCGRRNFSEYQDCPHKSCVKRDLMNGRVDFMSHDEKTTALEQPDIVDRLRAYAEASDMLGAYTEANCAYDAIKVIEDMRSALRAIGYDYVELSYDKVQYLYHEHIMIAKKAYGKSFPPIGEVKSPKDIDDNF